MGYNKQYILVRMGNFCSKSQLTDERCEFIDDFEFEYTEYVATKTYKNVAIPHSPVFLTNLHISLVYA